MVKRIVGVIVLAFMMANSAFGQKAESYSVERELGQLDREWGEAIVRRDAAALDRLLADDYTLITPTREVIGKTQEIDGIKTPVSDLILKSYKAEDVAVSVSGERATVTGRAVLKGVSGGQKTTQRYWYTRTFARRQGRWQIIAAQITSLSDGGSLLWKQINGSKAGTGERR